MIVQAAVSLVLLSAAAMLGQSLRNLEHQNFGFETKGRYMVSIDPKLRTTSRSNWCHSSGRFEDRLQPFPACAGQLGIVRADERRQLERPASSSRASRSLARRTIQSPAGRA